MSSALPIALAFCKYPVPGGRPSRRGRSSSDVRLVLPFGRPRPRLHVDWSVVGDVVRAVAVGSLVEVTWLVKLVRLEPWAMGTN